MGKINILNDAGTNKLTLEFNGTSDGTLDVAQIPQLNGSNVFTTSISGGDNLATTGSVLISDRYANGNLTTYGVKYSSGGPYIGYGARSNGGEAPKSTTTVGINRTIMHLGGSLEYFYAPAQTTAIGSNLTGVVKQFGVDPNGYMTVPYQPSFRVNKNGAATETLGAVVITSWSTGHNVGSCFNTTTGVFTAPVAGRYMFLLNCMASTTAGDVQYQLWKNGVQQVGSNNTQATGQSYRQTTVAAILDLSVNDYVDARAYSNVTNSNTIVYSGIYSHFSGHLLG